MQWLIEHWRIVMTSSVAGLLLFLWQRGFFSWGWSCIQTLRKVFRDQERADALLKVNQCEEELRAVKLALQTRVRTDDARDEIHQQDLAEKKQMSACIARLKQRLTENRIAFDDLL